ncbi:MAG TPA: carbohydrate kinase family protein [Candidatus Saccharimonadales bacterium]|nr:carbohydrate kinase family protein [Candidatus Saccharimonadales bacterium]
MAKNIKVLSIGKATQDVFLLGGSAFEPVRDKGVEYEHLPLGAKLSLQDIVFATGGNALNAATTFARQGLHSYFMGVVGTEPAGEVVLQTLDQEGINSQYVRQSPAYRTSYSTVLLAPGGERTILTYHGSKLRADGSDITLEAVAEADWLYVSSVDSMRLLEKIITIAAKNGTKVAINPSGRELAERDKLRTLLDDVSVLLMNKEEMQQIVDGKTNEELIRRAANITETVVLSDGPKGAWATDGKQLVVAGMYKDVKVVSRLGAGDAFGSGFVAMYAQGKSLADAVTFASANSTSVVQHIGATVGILHKGAPLHDMPLKIEDL